MEPTPTGPAERGLPPEPSGVEPGQEQGEPEPGGAEAGQGSEAPARRRPSLRMLLPLAALLVAVLLVLIPQLTSRSNASNEAQRGAVTAPATVPPTTVPPTSASPPSAPATSANPKPPAAKAVPNPGPAAAAPTRITVEAAGIDVAVLPLSPTGAELESQTIVPPFTDDGYWLTSYGTPGAGSSNTTYIAGHSWEGREAPFDRFSTHTEVGDIITVTTQKGKLEYRVDSIITHDKDTLKTSDIWNIVPNRLVLISCYTEDPWGKNVVVSASPVKG